VGVVVSVNVEAVSTAVSQVSSASWEVGESLSGIVWNVLSDDSVSVVSHELSSLVGDSIVPSGPGSDGSGSDIEGPPLLAVWLHDVLDNESVLVTTDVGVPGKSSASGHSGSELELSSVEWMSSVGLTGLVEGPSLVGTVVAVPEDNVSVVSV